MTTTKGESMDTRNTTRKVAPRLERFYDREPEQGNG